MPNPKYYLVSEEDYEEMLIYTGGIDLFSDAKPVDWVGECGIYPGSGSLELSDYGCPEKLFGKKAMVAIVSLEEKDENL